MSISVESTLTLAARWVQWAAAAGPVRHPIKDTTGRYAHRNQPADVFFLGGTFGGEVERTCAVPAGRPLFFPAFAMWCPDGTWIPPLPAAYGRVLVDGASQPLVTAGNQSETFPVRGAWLNPVTVRRSPVDMRVWGHWATVEPLPPGPRVIRIEGGDGEGFTVGVTYRLEVG